MNHFFRLMPLIFGILLSTSGFAAASDTVDPSAMVKAAKAGETVNLPAGTYTTTGLTLPTGVSLRGAGYSKTTIVVTGQIGIEIHHGRNSSISDLTVRDAVNSGIVVTSSSSIDISRVRAIGSLTGIMMTSTSDASLSNVVAAEDRTGIVMNACTGSDIVNCTLAQNTALGASIGINTNCAVFNNLIIDSPIGVYVSPDNSTLALDHNFYLTSSVGKCNDLQEPNVNVWRDSTGYDKHSVSLAVDFNSSEPDTYRTTTALTWAQDRAATSGWGAVSLGAFKAPTADIEGNPYRFGPCTGAWEVKMTASRPADGTLTIHNPDGVKSAGLFTKAGQHVVWLFNDLPLPAGKIDFWIPTRDWQGRNLAAGDYVVRISEANISFRPVGSGVGGNTGIGTSKTSLAQIANQQIVFDGKDRPLVAMGWSESQLNIRAFDADSPHERWYFPGTATHIGFADDGHGTIYSLRMKGNTPMLLRLDDETGATKSFGDGKFDRYYDPDPFSPHVGGMAILGGTIFLADTGANKLRTANVDDPTFSAAFDIASPTSPVADRARNLVWVLSRNTTVLGMNPDGSVKYRIACPVPGVQSIAISGNRMALLSYRTGKIHVYNCADPANLTPISTIGTGDGPYGPIQPDRFGFQGQTLGGDELSRLAMDSEGNIAVVDTAGIKEFTTAGAVKRNLIGGWYNSFELGIHGPGGEARVMDLSTGRSFLIDPKTKTSAPEINWHFPGVFMSMFTYHGVNYGLFRGTTPAVTPDGTKYWRVYICIARLDMQHGLSTPLIAWSYWADTTVRTDFTSDINAPYDTANWKPFIGPDGKPINFVNGAGATCLANGDLIFDLGGRLTTYRFQGLDTAGVPAFDWLHPSTITMRVDADDRYTSPYDFKTPETINAQPPNRIVSFMKDGGFARPVALKTGHMGALLGNWSGTDLMCFNADGKMRWMQPLISIDGVDGGWAVGENIYTVHIPNSETQIFSSDGLMLADLGQPKGLPWGGKWLDNALQFAPFKGNDGKTYMIYGDFNECCFYWMSIDGIDNVTREQVALHLSPERVALLSGQPLPTPPKTIAPPVTRVKITKLAGPMAIDGSLDKWRAAVPTPQVIITPESGSADITGPADCSALVRFAHDGSDLYVQVIKFDDVIVLDQPVSGFYLQDGVELGVNSYSTGFKVDVTRTLDAGDIMQIERFGTPSLTKMLDASTAPRNIKIYDDAGQFPERKLIENLYGIDLSKSKVMVTEFKFPINATTYAGDPKSLPDTSPGSTVWLGVMVDDNDIPGGDVQKYEVWPSTYGTFSGKEAGAIGTFE